jgi:hypothetical protein
MPAATSRTSLVYSNMLAYRLVMNVLYSGGYRTRFDRILARVPADTHSVCDLCFADTYIAEWCRARGISWIGIDINRGFCERAARQGFRAVQADLLTAELPQADVYLMAGSLYHFHDSLPQLLERILKRSRLFILSEPIRNLSSKGGLLGWLARHATNPGTRPQEFRFDSASLLGALHREQERLGFNLAVVSQARDLLVEIAR